MKKYFAWFTSILLALTFLAAVPVAAEENAWVDIMINGEVIQSDVTPFIENDRTLVPARVISENLQYAVDWVADEKKVTIQSESELLTLYIGSADYLLNGEKKTMDVAARIKDDRTFVPLRLIAEAFGCKVDWIAELHTVEIIQYNTIEVDSAYELLSNLKSYTRVLLKGHEYNLTDAVNESIYNPYVCKREVYAGTEYVVKNVTDLIIEAPEGVEASIVTESAYANVLNFNTCQGIELKNFTAGHEAIVGYCSGGVVMFENCVDAVVENCRLYGCGTYGISTLESYCISVNNTEIYDCSYGLVDLRDSYVIQFDNCIFRDTEGFSMFELNNCGNVIVSNSVIQRNVCISDSYFINAYECDEITFDGCQYVDNIFENFCNDIAVNFID